MAISPPVTSDDGSVSVEEWYTDYSTVVAVAIWAAEEDGALRDIGDVLSYFEKPWHHGDLFLRWVVEQKRKSDGRA